MIEARFHLRRGDFTLETDLRIPGNGVTALLGPSGCGKTTLLRAIAGLDHDADAYLKVGDSIWQEGARRLPPHQRPIGYVFQESSLFDHLSVRRNLEYGLRRVPVEQQKISFDQAVALLGIAPLLARKPATLSGGERQRVAIARALLVSPRLLLMDEPLASLDVARKHEILPYLDRLHEELDIPILYVSHSPDEVARIAEHLVLLDAGRVIAQGPLSAMLTRLDLPLAHGPDAEALIDATVAGQDTEFALTYLEFPGGRFSVAHLDLPTGHHARIRVLARDVSITLEQQTQTSILNIFPATVDAVSEPIGAQVTIRLLVNGVPMLSRITRKSASLLDLQPGKSVYAQAKSVAVLT